MNIVEYYVKNVEDLDDWENKRLATQNESSKFNCKLQKIQEWN